MMTSAIHEDVYGSAQTRHAHDEPLHVENVPTCSFLEQSKTQERQVPLVTDADGIYNDVLINPTKIRAAEMKALADLLFTKEELMAAHGVKGLDDHKLEALKEYMYVRCTALKLDQVQPKTLMTTIQNKIGNLRKKGKLNNRATLSTLPQE
ncbi:uncharacterized protein [Argopecten irradians]|uniref:uncharacterized protein n=1 Tax=Argopecten irradians TaxID=31199 RepID=UPI003711B462